MRITRLNLDTSWHLTVGMQSFVVDPWLVGSEIDGFSWFNEQWHTTAPVDVQEVPDHDYVVVTQPFADHCHLETLAAMGDGTPTLAIGRAARKVAVACPERRVVPIVADGPAFSAGEVEVTAFSSRRRLGPSFHTLLLSHADDGALLYAPHGIDLTAEQMERLSGVEIRLLMTTLTHFRLPAVLGGRINPGPQAARHLANRIGARYVVNTHDENKALRGVIGKIARRGYTDPDTLRDSFEGVLLDTGSYETVHIG